MRKGDANGKRSASLHIQVELGVTQAAGGTETAVGGGGQGISEEKCLDDWVEHIQGYRFKFHLTERARNKLRIEMWCLELEAVGVSKSFQDLLAQGLEGPCCARQVLRL